MCAKAVRRRVIDLDADCSEYFGLSFAENLLRSLPIANAVRGAYYIGELLYYYRVNAASLTRKFDLRQIDASGLVHKIHLGYARRWTEGLGYASLVEGVQTTGL